MEKLDPSRRDIIKKTSTLRLSAKLLEAGIDEAQIQAMDRGQMMTAWAELVADGTDKPPVPVAAGYDPELERQRLEFEMRRYEKEKEERRVRTEEEKEELRIRYEAEMRLKETELQIQMDRNRMNRTLANRKKVYADALKGTMTRMPMDVVHLLTYFQDVERLFTRFEVPDELRAHLLRPYLNEKGKILISRMDPQLANDYNEVKAMLLREFKQSPAVYLHKFNAETRKSDETCLLYSARLVAILDAYLNS